MSLCSDTVRCQPVGARPRFPEENPLGGGNFMRVPLLPTEKGGSGEADEDERIAFPQEPIEDDLVPRIPDDPLARPPYLVEILSFPPKDLGSGTEAYPGSVLFPTEKDSGEGDERAPRFQPEDGGSGGEGLVLYWHEDPGGAGSDMRVALRPVFPPDDGGRGGRDAAPRFSPLLVVLRPLFPSDDGGIGGQDRASCFVVSIVQDERATLRGGPAKGALS